MHRLETKYPKLARSLATLSSSQASLVAVTACKHAVDAASVSDGKLLQAIAIMGKGLPLGEQEKLAVRAVAEQLDNTYLDLNDAEKSCDDEFRAARAASAVAMAVDGSSIEKVRDVVYEALFAFEDESKLLAILNPLLNS